MRNLKFGFFDSHGHRAENRILIFYAFETDTRLTRSGILHYSLDEGCFVGPQRNNELTAAAFDWLVSSGRLGGEPQPVAG
jgi:hypothetical protein